MLADDCAPAHADSLTQSLSYAHGYADEVTRMLAAGNVDSDRAAQLVQALKDMILSATDDLYALDDVQQEIDAREHMRKMGDEELFLAITSEH
ncbi:hypothetical protein ACIA6T_07935 [Streptomyces sp. NPDC051740]|uniref:hypothetical protein n=1 Tax=Streptomyces sp. NPDC051740 TaxID=3365673 RepID=UPI00379B05E8